MRVRRSTAVSLAVLVVGLGSALAAGSASASTGKATSKAAGTAAGLLSTDPATFLAALGETPQEFLATSGGVTLDELHTQLVDQQSGLPIPSYSTTSTAAASAAGTPSPLSLTSLGGAGSFAPGSVVATPDAVYRCGATGSNEFEGSGGSLKRGFARLGFTESCNNPEGTVSSACTLSGTVGSKTFGPTSASGGDTCNNSQLVGVYNTGTEGTYRANWGGYNSAGVPFVGLAGCVSDGASASCDYKTSFTVGHNHMFALTAEGG